MVLLIISIYNYNIFAQDNTSDNTTDKTNATNTNTDTNNTNNEAETTNNQIQVIKNVPKNGWDLYLEGRYSESINALMDEKIHFPGRINIYVIMGWDYKYLRNYYAMERISLEGLNVISDDTRILQNLAESYYFQEKYADAIPIFQKYIALKFDKNDTYIPEAYYYLGDCFYNIKSYYKADIALSTAKYFQPNNMKLLLKLALVKEKNKDLKKAEEYYNTVIKYDANNNEAKEGLSRVKSLQ